MLLSEAVIHGLLAEGIGGKSMLNEIIKLSIMLLIMLILLCSFLFFYGYYRKYYKYMKTAHKEEWWSLMKRDPLVDGAGEWVRWPVGSIYLIISIFKTTETYNDKKVEYYKKKATQFFISFVISFICFLIIAALLPKL
ncbi:MAG: hypothetical protein FD156_1340 [Nitrospirae bacterium]|nr:MAG: hypothetical protein FD156_1340 [Nitrospirota bacterium]